MSGSHLLALLGAIGSVASIVSLFLSVAIFRWTKRDTDQMEVRLHAALAAVRDAPRLPAPASASADLQRMDGDYQAELSRRLQAGEVVVRLDRSGQGKGNHSWHAVTSQGRLITLSKGGRGRPGITVHVDEADKDA